MQRTASSQATIIDSDVLADLPVFLAVAEAGGFAAAALRLGQTRSAVSRAVGRLEGRLGLRLFHRTTRRIALTDDGQALFERSRIALGDLKATVASLASGQREATGRLRISAPLAFGRLYVAPILIALAADHPAMELDLHFNDRLVDVLGDGFDLVIRNGPLPDLPGLAGRHLLRQYMAIVAAPSYRDAHGLPASYADLPLHNAVLYGRPGRTHPWRLPQPGGRIDAVTPPSRIRFDDVGAIRDAAVAGHGLAWLPRWQVADDLREGRLLPVLDALPAFAIDSYLLWPQTPHQPLRVRLAIEALVGRLPGRVGDA